MDDGGFGHRRTGDVHADTQLLQHHNRLFTSCVLMADRLWMAITTTILDTTTTMDTLPTTRIWWGLHGRTVAMVPTSFQRTKPLLVAVLLMSSTGPSLTCIHREPPQILGTSQLMPRGDPITTSSPRLERRRLLCTRRHHQWLRHSPCQLRQPHLYRQRKRHPCLREHQHP